MTTPSHLPLGTPRSRATASSGGNRDAAGKNGMRPRPAQSVRRAIMRIPSSNSAESPRNLLTRKPRINAESSGSSTAFVPTIWAMTPPRSMSPISTTGVSEARAKPILAMSPCRKLISAGLPAPSTRTRSASAFTCAETVEHGFQQPWLPALIFARGGVADHAALHNDLRADVALRFEQDRIHVDAGSSTRQARASQRLRPADLAAIGRHGRVVRHVLRFERPDRHPAQRKGAAKPGDDQRFADVGPRALKHQRPNHL